MEIVQGNNCLEAWKACVRHLLANNLDVTNLLVEIANPAFFDPGWMTRHSPYHRLGDGDKLAGVINTVFPYKVLRNAPNRAAFYESYYRAANRLRRQKRRAGSWGTYFERLTKFGAKNDPVTINQLENAIHKLSTWQTRPKGSIVFHLSSPHLDNLRPRNGPCWQFGEIVWNQDDSLDLVAVYRNHDYYSKAFGNFIALGQLLKFVADESQKTSGKLICHSVRATSYGPSRSALRQLADC